VGNLLSTGRLTPLLLLLPPERRASPLEPSLDAKPQTEPRRKPNPASLYNPSTRVY